VAHGAFGFIYIGFADAVLVVAAGVGGADQA
jgi:hypothetical protein